MIDPVQSVKGQGGDRRVPVDQPADDHARAGAAADDQSNLGHLNKPSIQALIHGLNRHYYSINISYRKNELEEKMLLNLNKSKWSEGLRLVSGLRRARRGATRRWSRS